MPGGRPKKDEPPKALRSLMQMALDLGHEPGLFMLERMVEQGRTLRAWRTDVKQQQVPEGLEHLSLPEASALYCKEAADYSRLELQMLEYFHPKLRSTEAHVQHEGEVSLLEVMLAGKKAGANEGHEGGEGDE